MQGLINAKSRFQSTPPVKAATVAQSAVCRQADISIHAAREGGDATFFRGARWDDISIHAAREGGDGICPDCYRKMKISIHAAREGGDDNPQNCKRN